MEEGWGREQDRHLRSGSFPNGCSSCDRTTLQPGATGATGCHGRGQGSSAWVISPVPWHATESWIQSGALAVASQVGPNLLGHRGCPVWSSWLLFCCYFHLMEREAERKGDSHSAVRAAAYSLHLQAVFLTALHPAILAPVWASVHCSFQKLCMILI